MFKSFEAMREMLCILVSPDRLDRCLHFSQRTPSGKPLENPVIEIPGPLKTFL